MQLTFLRPLAVRIGALGFMPKLLPQITATDKALQRWTSGRVTILDLAGLPNLMLTVAGRKSGLPRTTPLLTVPRGDTWLIAGSNFGKPGEPIWVKNLEAADGARIRVDGVEHDVTIERLTGDARAAAWEHMLRTWPNFALYEQRTDREIKVFELTPVT